MISSEFIISAEVLVRVVVFLLYTPICLIMLRWLVPRLSPSLRLFAIGMLAAQILLLALGLQYIPRWDTLGWLLHLDQEWNFPSTFASAQLAAVGGAALLTALLVHSRHLIYRPYFAAVGALFFFLAWDEYFALHEMNDNWRLQYAAIGALVVIATLAVARLSPLRARIWHRLFISGLAVSGLGAIVFKLLPRICDSAGWLRVQGCVQIDYIEEAAEFAGVWLVLVAILGILTDATGKLGIRARLVLFLLPVIWTILLTHNAWLLRVELRFLAKPAAVHFEHETSLLGYKLELDRDAIALRLYPSAWRSHYSEMGFSVHLVDQASGKSVASRNRHSDLQYYLLQVPGYAHVYRQLITLAIPPETPRNRAYWIALSFWRDDGDEYEILKIRSSDLMLLGDAQVVLDELVLPAAGAVSSAAPLAAFDRGITLGAAEIPERAIPGEALPIRFQWTAANDISEDYIQFLHLGHQGSGEWWVYDQQPLGARLPTRLWYAGLTDSELWQPPLPADLEPGLYQVFTGLYEHRNRERLGAADATGEAYIDGLVPLGAVTIEERE